MAYTGCPWSLNQSSDQRM